MKPEMRIFLRAFLDGFTGAGLFRKLDIPGAPKEIFDSRPLDEIIASDEFAETCKRLLKQKDSAEMS